jgi:hypothetical protein
MTWAWVGIPTVLLIWAGYDVARLVRARRNLDKAWSVLCDLWHVRRSLALQLIVAATGSVPAGQMSQLLTLVEHSPAETRRGTRRRREQQVEAAVEAALQVSSPLTAPAIDEAVRNLKETQLRIGYAMKAYERVYRGYEDSRRAVWARLIPAPAEKHLSSHSLAQGMPIASKLKKPGAATPSDHR